MRNITLLCSVHHENGLCNVGELLKILRAIEPEVVFEEMLPSHFGFYYKHRTISTLESQALTTYREFKSFQQVPVDRYEIAPDVLAEIKKGFEGVCARVEQISQEYRELDKEKNNRVYQLGFKYLNSVAYSTLMARIFEIEDQTITQMGDHNFVRALEMWRHALQERERAMIRNIYDFSRDNAFDAGIFLVGAAHKMGIIREIEKHARMEAGLISWRFAYE